MTAYQQLKKAIGERDYRRDKEARRRAKRAGAVTQHVKRERIRRRDNFTCYLCDLYVSHADMSLDHLIPLSRGGSHTYDNIRLTHKACNHRKADRHPREVLTCQ